jgi:hypothetical protein
MVSLPQTVVYSGRHVVAFAHHHKEALHPLHRVASPHGCTEAHQTVAFSHHRKVASWHLNRQTEASERVWVVCPRRMVAELCWNLHKEVGLVP